ncbi:DUF4013 domain-containing protein [Halalkalicoccus jeotgali]|uniref:DUF4013 domain-containing protein n=1 Tax=Halalkalicoccus jeotgali (strain DSM 18796 / CECT 7217 / JCM 14584 / KCTC 4019 / B3) TaxID=795797 RepID=D8J393_HALJB|nr:DUF4013 domain-containing protein [Halalkalicoccus jeotgali]ADJ15200.1 hypothetical protein HacjB3_09085 [Halalkalicoccus jeotgali B3]ELY35223.1 hypothetical protein C497_13593 [Halalkalicoccus jeotgali B3]
MIAEAIGYLQEDDDAATTVLLGGVLTLFGFLLVPLFAVAGYLIRVLDRTARGDDEPPAFDEWGALIVDGLKASIIAFVYALVPTAVLLAFLVSGGLLGASGSDVLGAIAGIGVLLGLLVWFALTLLVAYAVPAALANFAETRRLGAGFESATMRRVLVDKTYATGWLSAFVIVVAGGVVTSVLSMVPVLGLVAGAFVGFYTAVAAYYVVGHTWGEIRHPPMRQRPEISEQAGI